MILLMNREENLIEYHVNRILKENEQFQKQFNCSLNQHRQMKKNNYLLPEVCAKCRRKKKQ
jgi:hypothetical protein